MSLLLARFELPTTHFTVLTSITVPNGSRTKRPASAPPPAFKLNNKHKIVSPT